MEPEIKIIPVVKKVPYFLINGFVAAIYIPKLTAERSIKSMYFILEKSANCHPKQTTYTPIKPTIIPVNLALLMASFKMKKA